MSDLPRLLLCSFDIIPGPTGASRRLTEYVRDLSTHFSVDVLCAKTPDHSHIQRFHGARLLRVPVGTGDLISRVQSFDRAVRRQLESEDYAIAHFTDPFGGYALCELRDQHGHRLVYDAQGFPSQDLSFHQPELEGDQRFRARVRRQELFCLMNADRVITGSEMARGFIHSLGVSRQRIEVIRAPVDLAAFGPHRLEAPPGSSLRLLYLGSQVAWQGLPTLLRAMETACRTIDVRLALVGPPHQQGQPLLEGLVEELKLGDRVDFLPPVPHEELPPVLADSDVGVLPLEDVERNRLLGGDLSKAADYLAAGLPVIASDLPITRELLPPGATAFHRPGDVDELAAAIVEVGRDVPQRRRMAEAAREAAKTFHDGARARRRLLAVYRELARQDPAAAPVSTVAPPLPVGAGKTDPNIVPASLRTEPAIPTPPPIPVQRPPGREPAKETPPRVTVTPVQPSRPKPEDEEVDEVSGVYLIESEPLSADDAAVLLSADDELVEPDEVAAVPWETAPPLPADDVVELADDVIELDPEPPIPPATPLSVATVRDAPASETVPSRLDPWFAQLVHGYCPPEGAQFARPTPPTNFPGREGPPPPTVQPAAPTAQTFPSRSGGG